MIGRKIGPFDVVGLLGEGGMGQVYRAHDAQLARDVAIKVLPESFAHDPDRLARFAREARALAALNHPNIAQVYGVEGQALVMELVEGRTLDDLIRAAPADASGAHRLPIDEVLSIARQIALALEAAHEQGIVHRDLKPANIKVRPDGQVKVLDFGLAKAGASDASGATAGGDLSNSPTLTAHGTEIGSILGTPAYMSPEQARGRAVDKRSDIWAFGVVLWEMLTGRQLFGGETVSDTLAAVIKDRPRLEDLPPDTPAALRRLLARCLERDQKQRLRDIGEARIGLDAPDAAVIGVPASSAALPKQPASWRGVVAMAIAGVIFAAIVGVVVWRMRAPAPVAARWFELPALAQATDYAIAPDGSRVAYLAGGHLFVRAFDALDPVDLGAVPAATTRPFWSRDSTMIGYLGEGSVRTVPAGGGPVFVVCQIPASGRSIGATWLADGNIVFAVWRDSLYKVPATGGTPAVHLAIDPKTDIDFHNLTSLPDGRLIVQTHRRTEGQDLIELVDGTTRTTLTTDQSVGRVEHGGPGYLLFSRRAINAGLWAVPFTGSSIDTSKATRIQAATTVRFSTAIDGTLVVSSSVPRQASLVWVDRRGSVSPVPGPPLEITVPDLAVSPKGDRAAILVGSSAESNLVVRDLRTGVDTPLTFSRPTETGLSGNETFDPVWFPSGDRVLYYWGRPQSGALLARQADGAGTARQLTQARRGRVTSDGKWLYFAIDDRGSGRLRRAPLLPDGSVGAAEAVFSGPNEPNVGTFDISPDDALLAYVEVQPSRRLNIFITELPAAANRWLVTEGGNKPRFSPAGAELFFLKGTFLAGGAPVGTLLSTTVTTRPAFKLGAPATIITDSAPGSPTLTGYDVTPDGKRLLMWKQASSDTSEATRVVFVQNWMAAIAKR